MKTFTPAPKPVRDSIDYQAKAIETAGKIATFDGQCAMPGCRHTRDGGFDIVPHHIIHRKYGNTCADPENLFPVCTGCHSKIHHDETAFKAWLETVKPGLYDRLWQKAREICWLDWIEVYAVLLERWYFMMKTKRDAEEGKAE